jgi:hypothetical protein
MPTYPVSISSFSDGFLDEFICDESHWLLIEDGVHKGNAGSTTSGLSFGRAALKQIEKFRQS